MLSTLFSPKTILLYIKVRTSLTYLFANYFLALLKGNSTLYMITSFFFASDGNPSVLVLHLNYNLHFNDAQYFLDSPKSSLKKKSTSSYQLALKIVLTFNLNSIPPSIQQPYLFSPKATQHQSVQNDHKRLFAYR